MKVKKYLRFYANLYFIFFVGAFASCIERQQTSKPSVIVIGSGISGIAAAHVLNNADFEVKLL